MLSIILITYLFNVAIIFLLADFQDNSTIVTILLSFIAHTSLLINALLSQILLIPFLLIPLTLFNSFVIFLCIVLLITCGFIILKILLQFKKFKWIETYLNDY